MVKYECCPHTVQDESLLCYDQLKHFYVRCTKCHYAMMMVLLITNQTRGEALKGKIGGHGYIYLISVKGTL